MKAVGNLRPECDIKTGKEVITAIYWNKYGEKVLYLRFREQKHYMSELKSKMERGLLWGGINSGLTQVLNLVFGIVLARLLSPHDYGIVGVLVIFSTIAGNLQNCGFVNGLINLKSPSSRDYNSVFWFNISVSFVIYIILFISSPLISWYFKSDELLWLSRFVFLSFFVSSFGIAPSALLTKRLMVKEKAIAGFLGLSISGIVGVFLAFMGYGYWSLAWQGLVYITVVNVVRYYYTWRLWRPSLRIDFGPVKTMFPFSVNILITNIAGTINTNVLTFLFGRMFPMSGVGNYSQAQKWSFMGYSLISGTVEQVAQPVLRETRETGGEKGMFLGLVRLIAFFSFPLMFGLALVSEEFILVLLGGKWLSSAFMLRILSIGGAFMPLYVMYQNLAISKGRSDIYMKITLGQIVIQGLIILGLHGLGMEKMVMAVTAFLVLWLGVWQRVAYKLSGIRFKDVLRGIMPYMLVSLAVMLLSGYITKGISGPVWILLSRIALSVVLYILAIRLICPEIMRESLRALKIKRRK